MKYSPASVWHLAAGEHPAVSAADWTCKFMFNLSALIPACPTLLSNVGRKYPHTYWILFKWDLKMANRHNTTLLIILIYFKKELICQSRCLSLIIWYERTWKGWEEDDVLVVFILHICDILKFRGKSHGYVERIKANMQCFCVVLLTKLDYQRWM